MQIDNLILEKRLGKGSFGEVFLTTIKGDNKYYATKKYERETIEKSGQMKYLKNEINILQNLSHPNIVKFIDIKKTKKHYYIVMEYCNGGELFKALEKYQLKYGKPFPQELVQYFMRQIISAFKHIHERHYMHRDIKLQNILLNYESEQDKKDFNLMKAQVKIIDFGFACKIKKDGLAFTTIGNPMHMDPKILQQLNSNGNGKQLGYDQKSDIWSLGVICYEMLIGRAAFDAEDMDELVSKIESGKYKVPTSLSKEVVSFLNGMLQYDAKTRLDINQLSQHKFIINNVKDFHSIDLKQVSNKLDKTKQQIIIDVKKNRSIWAIFNKEDEKRLIGIGNLETINETNEIQQKRKYSQERKSNKNLPQENLAVPKSNTFQMKDLNVNNIGIVNQGYNNYNNNLNNQQNIFYGPYLPLRMQGIPGNQMNQNNNYIQQIPYPQGGQTLSTAQTTESHYIYSGGIYGI